MSFFSIAPNQMAKYPEWLNLFLVDIILPCIAILSIALKIILKNGKDIVRELFQDQPNLKEIMVSNSAQFGVAIINLTSSSKVHPNGFGDPQAT